MLKAANALAKAINRYFEDGDLNSELRESIIIVLRKPGKKNYFLLGSYRSITLENTIVKVIKKALANRLRDVTKKHKLLL